MFLSGRTKSGAYAWAVGRRGVAVLLVTFYVAAAFRGFVPGMCGTLNAVSESQSVSCCKSECLAPADENAVRLEVSRESRVCAFCSLVNAPAEAAEYAYALIIERGATEVSALAHVAPATRLVWSPASRRGPPSRIS